MLFKASAVLALGASAALASPLQRFKRQETTTVASVESTSTDTAAASSTAPASGSESVTGSAAQSTATSSVEATATGSSAASSAASSVESAISSIAASSGASAAPNTTTPANDTSSAASAFGCPEGYSLTYVIGTSIYPDVQLEEASSALSNWTGALPPPIMAVSSEGEGVGAMRTWEALNITAMEVLVNQTNGTDGALTQMWNLTAPINVTESLVIANATSDLTLFTNTTTNDTSAQLFVNFCVNDQPAGLNLYAEIVTAYLTGLNELFSANSTSSGNSTTAAGAATTSAESTTSGSMMSSSAATDSAASSASSATDSAASGASGALGTATSGASGALETATSGAASVASTAVGGLTSVLGDATSAVGGVTALIPTRA